MTFCCVDERRKRYTIYEFLHTTWILFLNFVTLKWIGQANYFVSIILPMNIFEKPFSFLFPAFSCLLQCDYFFGGTMTMTTELKYYFLSKMSKQIFKFGVKLVLHMCAVVDIIYFCIEW